MNLFDQITDFETLYRAAKRSARGKWDRHTVARFLFYLEPEILQLQRELLAAEWRPGSPTTFPIHDPKPRLISAAPFRDRVVHHAIVAAIEPSLERVYIYDSYACRKAKGSHAAVLRTQWFAGKYPWFLKSDIRKFYDSINHDVLLTILDRRFRDSRLLLLLETIILRGSPGCPPGYGLPIGNLTSQHFGNFYLDQLDHFVKDDLAVPGYLRYMDDFVLFDRDRIRLKESQKRVAEFLEEFLRLRMHPRNTFRATTLRGVPFLGVRIYPATIRMRRSSLRRSVRKWQRQRQPVDSDRCVATLQSLAAHLSAFGNLRLRRRLFHSQQ